MDNNYSTPAGCEYSTRRRRVLQISKAANLVEVIAESSLTDENRRKLAATVQNAQAGLRLRQEVGGEAGLLPFFYAYVGGRRSATNPAPPFTPESTALSQDLKRRGFVMTGPVSCYNLLQTAGLVNDHWLSCPRHVECAAMVP